MTTKIKLSSNVADVDLTTTAPTNGQGLIYNSTSSKWVPGAAGGGVTVYATINDLPLTGMSTGDLALVDSTNKLYLWMDTGWYNIATINTNPSITAGNNTPYLLALDGTPTVITLTASDPEGIPLTWSYEVTSGSLTNGGGTTATVSNDGSGQFTVTPTTTEAYAGEFSLTFKASDGVNLGTTVAAFTLAFRVADSKYTSLLVKALASGANSTFVDSSANNFTITKNGDVTQGTFSPFSQPDGAWSNYFDGAGDYLSASSAAATQFGAGDFTMETWVFPTSVSGGQLFYRRTTVSAIGMIIQLSSGNVNLLAGDANTSGWEVNLTSTSAVAANTWSHIAVTRSGSTWTIFINGTSAGTATASFTIAEETGAIKIGDGYSGYMSNWRVVKDTAITPPSGGPTTPLEAVTGTGLLTCQSNRFKDNSTNGFAITVAGNTAVSPFGPFDRLAYDPAIHGGGAYFDGTGDYLVANNEQFGASNLTIELFVNTTSTTQYATLISKSPAGFAAGMWTLMVNHASSSAGDVALYVADYSGATTLLISTGVKVTDGAWHHIAIVRNGSSWVLYVDGASVGTGTWAGTIASIAGDTNIGRDQNYGRNYAGHISNVRVVNGSAVYTSAFTPPTAPLTAITNTSLLLNCTNADIIDNDSKNNLKLVGNTAASATQTKYAARSVYFDGTGDYLSCPTVTPFLFGTGDFTVELWVYIPSSGLYQTFFSTRSSNTSSDASALYFGLYTGTLTPTVYGSTEILRSSIPLTQNTWTHIAATRENGVLRIFVNGIQSGSTSYTVDLNLTSGIATIGQTAALQYPLNGYIEDLRITKGLARYTANFTPPTSELLG